jgi:hypothetical protein
MCRNCRRDSGGIIDKFFRADVVELVDTLA